MLRRFLLSVCVLPCLLVPVMCAVQHRPYRPEVVVVNRSSRSIRFGLERSPEFSVLVPPRSTKIAYPAAYFGGLDTVRFWDAAGKRLLGSQVLDEAFLWRRFTPERVTFEYPNASDARRIGEAGGSPTRWIRKHPRP